MRMDFINSGTLQPELDRVFLTNIMVFIIDYTVSRSFGTILK